MCFCYITIEGSSYDRASLSIHQFRHEFQQSRPKFSAPLIVQHMHACWHHAPVAIPSLPFNRCLNYYTQLFSSHTLNHPTVRTYKWYSAGFPNPSAPNKWNIIYTDVASLFAPTMPNPNPKPIDRPVALCASLHMVRPNISSPISLHPKIVWPFFRHPLLSHS